MKSLPALFMRGGTSKGVVVHADALPSDGAERNRAFLSLMGSPDPYGRQLDGMGGGLSSLSKICIISPSSDGDADVDYTFVQIPVDGGEPDYSGSCGNMAAAIGPAALQMGILRASEAGAALVRIREVRTGKLIHSRFAVADGQYNPQGDLAIDGVTGTGGAVRLEFLAPGGSRTGKLLPTGNASDLLKLKDGMMLEATCIDAAIPCVFVEAASLGCDGTELPGQLEEDRSLMEKMEDIRCAAAVAMRLAPDAASARAQAAVPRVALIARPRDYRTISGEVLSAERQSIVVRMLSMGQAHRAVPVTGAICLAVAARTTGTLPARLRWGGNEPIDVAHPSGRITVDANVQDGHDPVIAHAVSGAVLRTARLLFSGDVWYR